MKNTMIIAIALASITAVAAPAKKKAVAAKKQKAAVVAAQAAAPVPAQAPATAIAPAAQATEERQVASAEVQVSPAAQQAQGASNANVAAQAAPKKWGAKAQLYSTTDFTNTQNIQNLTTFSGSYKVLPKLSVKLGQTFETLTNGRDTSEATRELTKTNNFRTAYTDIGASTSLPGFAGSDELPLSVNFRVMGGESEYTTTGGYSTSYNLVDVNFSVPYTLSPKWSLSIDTQYRTVDNKPKWKTVSAEGETFRREDVSQNSNRFIVGPSLTYAINDTVSVYQAASWIGSFKDAEALRRNYERIYLETGVTVTPQSVKGLSMTFMVDQDKAVYASPSSNIEVSGFSLYKPTEAASGPDATLDAVAYEAVIAYSF
jgi:hypothetical protein